MILKDLKKYIESFPANKNFKFGITKPFSWRGSYDEVAFSIVEAEMTREDILANIELAYTETFRGYKGGIFTYEDNTKVNFESEGNFNYSAGTYVELMIDKIKEKYDYESEEHRLVKLAFS